MADRIRIQIQIQIQVATRKSLSVYMEFFVCANSNWSIVLSFNFHDVFLIHSDKFYGHLIGVWVGIELWMTINLIALHVIFFCWRYRIYSWKWPNCLYSHVFFVHSILNNYVILLFDHESLDCSWIVRAVCDLGNP